MARNEPVSISSMERAVRSSACAWHANHTNLGDAAGRQHTRACDTTPDYMRSAAHLAPWNAQGHMEHSAILCEVDLFAIEHGINLLPELCAVCQIDQKLHAGRYFQ
jgi:hypothetical protein